MPVLAYLSSWLHASFRGPRDPGRSSARRRAPRRRTRHRLTVEPLEHRLPPGDLLGGLGLKPFESVLGDDLLSRPAAGRGKEDPAATTMVNYPDSLPELAEPPGSNLLDWPPDFSTPEPAPAAEALAPERAPLDAGDPGDAGMETPFDSPPFDGSSAPEPEDTPANIVVPAMPPSEEEHASEVVAEPPLGDKEAAPPGSSGNNAAGEGIEELVEAAETGGENQVSPQGSHDTDDGGTGLDDGHMKHEGDPGDSTGQGDPEPGGLAVVLQAPEFTNNPSPQVVITVDAGPGFPVGTLSTARVDVDLDHNGSFDDPGEPGYATESAQSALYGLSVTLPWLENGTYQLRARVSDTGGGEWVSAEATMQVDRHAGYLGSDALYRLYLDYEQVVTTSLDVFTLDKLPRVDTPLPWVGGQLDAIHGDYDYPTFPRPPLTPEEFQADLRSRFVTDAQDRVLVNVRSTLERHLPGLVTDLQALGMQVVNVTGSQNLITGFLPIGQIPLVIRQANYATMTPVYPPIRRTGLVTSQGDATILGDVFRSGTGTSGAGITVGVISDSANRVGGGLAASQASGDISSSAQVVVDGFPFGATDEGRAMMEIIQDVAPGADLLFHTADGGPQFFANGIITLAQLGANVVVDDIGYSNSPFFNDGVIAQAADLVASQGVTYVTAAGNDSDDGWMDAWRPLTIFGGQMVQDFGGGDFRQDFTLMPMQRIMIAFQWDDAFLEGGSPLANFQVQTDMNVVVNAGGSPFPVGGSFDNNLITDEALEFLVFTNNGMFGTNNFSMTFRHVSGPAPTRLRWIAMTGGFLAVDPNAEYQGAPTIFGQPAARGAIAVGAVPWFSPSAVEPFSSLGGSLSFLFDANGNRLGSPDVRFKPEVAGPDGVSTTFFQGPMNIFFGTSAAAPHVAAGVALLLEFAPGVTPANILQHLQQTALDVDLPGNDPLTGAGLVQVVPIVLAQQADIFEVNETSDQAVRFGRLNGTETLSNLTIFQHSSGFPDYDWFRWTADIDGTLTVTLNTVSTIGGDLELFLFTLHGPTLVEVEHSISPGQRTRTLTWNVAAGDVILVEVKGRNSALGVHDEGVYNLTVDLA